MKFFLTADCLVDPGPGDHQVRVGRHGALRDEAPRASAEPKVNFTFSTPANVPKKLDPFYT